jgi:hypothetical protein
MKDKPRKSRRQAVREFGKPKREPKLTPEQALVARLTEMVGPVTRLENDDRAIAVAQAELVVFKGEGRLLN